MISSVVTADFAESPYYFPGQGISDAGYKLRLPKLYDFLRYKLSLKDDALDRPIEFVMDFFPQGVNRRLIVTQSEVIVDCFANRFFKLVV
jgi:hypothetical protein